jgi:hypothetical protein
MRRQLASACALCATLLAAMAGLSACGSAAAPPAHPSQPATSQSQPPASQPASPSSSPSSSTTPVSCQGGWRTGPLSVTGTATATGIPVITAVRTGSHPDCRFDRLVIDSTVPVPSYSVSFVHQVIQDASGKIVTVPGTKYLVIHLKSARAHLANGNPTLPVGVQLVNDHMLRAYTQSGDFEGVVSLALGLAGGSSYRVGQLGGRIYIDVAW